MAPQQPDFIKASDFAGQNFMYGINIRQRIKSNGVWGKIIRHTPFFY